MIIDGQNIDLPLNLKTVADHLSEGGWSTSAYGKWDCGMTTWGSTPTCRGYGHYNGFYSAASDYYTHTVGAGFDYHFDFQSDFEASDVYTTEKVTAAVQAWIKKEVASPAPSGAGMKPTFALVMHEAVHGPLEAPMRFIDGACRQLVPDDQPSRLIYCGMVRAMDESVGNITQTYKDLGLWDNTLVIMSADNGGNPGEGGNNFPLRGMKATTWEGGVRGLGWIYGAGLTDAVRGTISNEIYHVTDWLPTLVKGVAGLPLNATGRACPTCNRTVAPFDGVDQWPSVSQGRPSARTEVLLDLQASTCWLPGAPCLVPGSGALRIGKWKLIHGHPAVWKKFNAGGIGGDAADFCALRSGTPGSPKETLPITANTSSPWCANGWTPPPTTRDYQPPILPPGSGCTGLPCTLNHSTSTYLTGGTWLFDVVDDPFEHVNVAATNPDVVKTLLARLAYFNDSHCGGSRCEPVKSIGPQGEPSKAGSNSFGISKVWMPWRGDPNPDRCDTNATSTIPPGPAPRPAGSVRSSLDLQPLRNSTPAATFT